MGIFRQRDSFVAEAQPESKTVIGIGGLIAIPLLFFALDVLSWFTVKGGIFSFMSAVFSVPKPIVLDIDGNGLLFPTIVIVWFTGIGLCRLFGIQLNSTQTKEVLTVFAIIGGGFFLSAAYGEAIITTYMTSHGYSRCEDGDWAQGNGKSRVWFVNYVRQDVECRRRKNTVPEYSAF